MNYFVFKNIDSRDIKGLIVQELPPISKPAKKVDKIEIDGRDGDIIEEKGYQAYDKTISIGLTRNYDINQIIFWLDGLGELILSNEPDKYYSARIIEEIDFERLVKFKTAKIKFHCQPFKHKANEEYLLVKDRKDKTKSGTSIDINDSAEMRINELKISGNSRQKTRSGKNRIGFKNCDKTINGVRIIVKDGVITLNGTCTADNTLILGLEDSMHKNTSIKVGNSLSAFYVSGSMNGYLIYRLFDNNYKVNSLLDISVLNTTKTYIKNSINTNFTIEPNNCNFRINKDTIFNNFSFKLMFTDNEDSTYEPYGASPSPDYPSEVESCGDNVNIYDKDNNELKKGLWNTTNTLTNNENGFYIVQEITGGDIYSISKKFSGNDYQGLYLSATTTEEYPSNNVVKVNNWIDKGTSGKEITIQTDKKANYLFVGLIAKQANTVTEELKEKAIEELKIEKGSTPTPYSKYGQGNINVEICNENIFKNEEIENAYIDKNGTYNSNVANALYPYIKVKPNSTWAISANVTMTNLVILEYDKNKTFLQRNGFSNTKSGTCKVSSKCEYIRVNLNYSNSTSITKEFVDSLDIQLKEGTLTDYTPHKSQTYTIPTQKPFRKVGDYKDTFIRKNGKWYERHFIKRLILDNTINIIKASEGFYIKVPTAMNLSPVYCNNFKNYNKSSELTAQDYGIGFLYNGVKNLYIRNIEFNEVSEFKSWILAQYNAGTPVYIDYVLETPLDIECTEEQSTILWDIEQNAKTYDKVTHIYSTDEIGTNVEVTYFTPTNEIINNEGNIQSRPILRLEKTVSEAVELTINDIRFKYNFKDDSYVEIDCEEKTVEYEGLKRNRQIIIGYEFPKLNIGNNDIKIHEGDCIIKILRKDRWL